MTVFLPPEPIVAASLALPGAALSAFWASHIVHERVMLPAAARNVSSTVSIAVSVGGVVGPAGRRGVLMREVVCDGGLIQVALLQDVERRLQD